MNAYQHIVEKLKKDGENGLKSTIAEEVECFFLDYKEVVEDFSNKTSLGQYWGTLAKSISGFGNALGGILVFGVKNSDKSLSAFGGYKNFEKIVNEFVSRSTNPKHESIYTFSFQDSVDTDKGYVVVEIPQSRNRPLQVISNDYNHRYFYRSGESHTDIPHDVLVGMLGYKIPPKLVYQLKTHENQDDKKEYFEFEILLRNAGSIIAKDVWLNIDIGIPNVQVLGTDFSDQFEGSKLSHSCSLITKSSYKLPPQGILSVLKIHLPKNNLDEKRDYYFYFTFGCDGSKINEFNAQFKGNEFNEAIESSFENFMDFLKEKSPGHVVERL